MMAKRKICIVTGSRAEYGLLQGLLKEVAADPDLELQVCATGMHLSPEFGLTYQQIEADGFTIDAKVETLLSSDSPVGVTKSTGLGVVGFADALERLNPDVLVVLGDRFEILAAAQAAIIAGIPIAHIHGGEATEGAFDDSIRHAITKMAQYHFVAAEPYRKRVIQLGEAPDRVFNFGAPGLDTLHGTEWLDRACLEESLGIPLKPPIFLITYHPATRADRQPIDAFNELLEAMDDFQEATVVFTYPNADPGGRVLIQRLDEWVSANQDRARAFVSLGQRRYQSLMREADLVIGNSSSGIIDAPAHKTPTINLGSRQKGRLRASSVIDADEDKGAIVEALNRALSSEFRATLPATVSLYGTGEASVRIKATLKSIELSTGKVFFDIGHGY
jgi:UDP-hydrolysing UDP-N-acetyl-D-glucosamine 2-epimerase